MSKRQMRRFGSSGSPPQEVRLSPSIEKCVPRPLEDRQHGGCNSGPALGLATLPRNINDVAPGDAAAGKSQFRRGQFFTQLVDDGVGIDAVDLVWNRAIGMATDRSSDTRPRFFHVSFFNYGVTREVPGVTVPPLTEAEIQTIAGRSPSISMLRGRVQIFDESGGRFFDVDILGTRSFSFYAFGVTASILLPNAPDGTQLGFEINAQATTQPQLGPGVVEDSFAAARIVPIFQNATQIVDSVTRTVEVLAGGASSLEIPPGTTRVQLRTSFDRTAIPADYVIGFSAAPTSSAAASLGQIFVIPGTTETDTIEVPNSKFIVFVDSVGAPSLKNWIVTFTVES